MGNISSQRKSGHRPRSRISSSTTRAPRARPRSFTARAGVLRVKSIRDPLSTGFDATTLGLPAYMTAPTGTKAFPQFSAAIPLDGRRRIRDHPPLRGRLPVHGLGDQDHRRPHHQGRRRVPQDSRELLPAEYCRAAASPSAASRPAQNPLVSSSTQGDGLASALLGFGSGGTVSIDYPTAQSAGYFGTYVNDDWRISRKLTLNLGLR